MAKVEILLNQVNPATMAVIDGTSPLRMVAATPGLAIELSGILRGQRGEKGDPGARGEKGETGNLSSATLEIDPVLIFENALI